MNELIIKPGDVYSAGHHRFSCADIEKYDVCNRLSLPKNIYMVYSDPPWNPGNAKMWRTSSNLDGVTGRQVNWDNFVYRFCKIAAHSKPEHLFIEMGLKSSADFVITARRNGFPEFKKDWNVFYNYTHPNKVLYFSNNTRFMGNPEGMKNEPITRHIFEHIARPGEIVFDPCIGLGMTARMAHEFDMICYGNELNPKRLEKTLLWLSKKGYEIIRL